MKHPMTRIEEQDDNARFGTDKDLTSPEAVERWKVLPYDTHSTSAVPSKDGKWVQYSDYAALSAERDALKAALAKAVGVLEESLEAMHEAHSECRDYADTHPFIEQLDSARERAAAFLARHQKETDT